MAGAGLSFSVEGSDRIERILERSALRMTPEGMMVLNNSIVEGLKEHFKANWPMGVAADLPQTHTRWPAASLLDNTGRLRASLTEGNADTVRVVTPYEIRYGTKLYYGRFINDGTVNMQPRPFMKLSVSLRAEIVKTVKAYVGFTPDLRFSSGFAE